jgi:hypothetical protein
MSFNHEIKNLKFHINKLVPKDVCRSFIDYFENNSKYYGIEKSYKNNSKEIEFDNFTCINLNTVPKTDKKAVELFTLARLYISIMITNYVLHIKKDICPTYNVNFISKTSNIRILRYEKGQCIKDHCDVGDRIRASCTLNLNEDYEGGEFRFFNGQIKHSFKTGDAMIFPAEPIWDHGTEPITKGVRYSINCFLQS